MFTNTNKSIPLAQADSGRIELFLPLVGKEAELKFTTADKKVATRQLFNPLVSPDWGYFGKGTIHIICSSHQDIAWMNTPDSCREERIHDIIIPALDQIGKNPAFKFEMEQTLNLMEVLEAVPSEKQRIINAYKSGQFTWGATFNQPYEGLESGEQLVRQTYLGRKWIKDNLPGMDALAAYNIDVPGRTPQIPQILDKSGIRYLVISRMKEGFYDWYSPDGSKVLTYSPGNYGWALLVYQYFEEDVITAFSKMNAVLKNWDEYYAGRNIPAHYGVVISTDAGGKVIPSQMVIKGTERSVTFEAENIPSLGYKTYFLKKGRTHSDSEIKAGTNYYENRFYSVKFGPGGITSLTDRELDRQVFNSTRYAGGDLLSLGYSGNGAGEFTQVIPTNFDGSESLSMKGGTWSLISNGPVYAAFESTSVIRDFTVRQVITFYHHIKRIDFEYDIPDWKGRESVDYTVLQGILLSSHKSCHGEGNWYHQTGSHQFRFSFTSHKPGWKNGYHFGVEGNHPLCTVVKDKPKKGTLPPEKSFVSVSSPFVRVTALKRRDSDNSLIIRIVEMGGVDKKVDIKLWFPAESLIKTNMIEENQSDTGQKGMDLKFDLGRNSIETYKIGLKD